MRNTATIMILMNINTFSVKPSEAKEPHNFLEDYATD
jgi:hypothetical protein